MATSLYDLSEPTFLQRFGRLANELGATGKVSSPAVDPSYRLGPGFRFENRQ